MPKKQRHVVLCNANRDDANKIISRLGSHDLFEKKAIATPGYTADENNEAGLIGIACTQKTFNKHFSQAEKIK